MSRLVPLLALALLLPLASFVAAEPENAAPRVSEIAARLAPPFTFYHVEALDPDLDALTYEWTLSDAGLCRFFEASAAEATWQHDDERACPHDAASHPGTITVVVSDGLWRVTRVYAGGSAAFDPGEHRWREEDYVPKPGGGTSVAAGTTERPSTTPEPSGDDPNDTPPPTLYGEDLDCAAPDARGAFQPVQAVWQDEDLERFPDLEGKRLVIEGPRKLKAELPMVKDKLTLLFGLRGDRAHLQLAGNLTGRESLPAVVRFTLEEAGQRRVLGEVDVGPLPIGGACGAPTRFDLAAKLDSTSGLAIPHFAPKAEGPFTITMELAEKGGKRVPGTQVVLEGTTRAVPRLDLYFVPAVLVLEPIDGRELAAFTRMLAAETAANLPDYYPLPSKDGATALARPVPRDLRGTAEEAERRCDHPLFEARSFSWCFVNAVQTLVESKFAAGSWKLGTGAAEGASRPDRIVMVVSDHDMKWLYPPKGANGFAGATKLVTVKQGVNHLTVGHEIAHVTPAFTWLNETGACTVDYHNRGGARGHGFQATVEGEPARHYQGPKRGMMGGGGFDRWIEQCTYWHLVNNLPTLEDPTLVGVRGWIARDESAGLEVGAFEPGMTFEGEPDRPPGGEGRFAVVLEDAAGDELARYRFDHPFEDEEGRPRQMVSFGFAVPKPDGLARIRLAGPSGTLATMVASESAPVLASATAARVGGGLAVTWSASDPDGDALTFDVTFSPDGGRSWYDVALDARDAGAEVPPEFLALGRDHLVRVHATDGVHSATREVSPGGAPPGTPGPDGSAPAPGERTPGPAAGLAVAGVALAALVVGRRGRRAA